ncbi:MAG: PTS sugar transporter subunit IIB [Treponema sp.]|nr:PTS sugar transporter subunit IIB [Treponema sp.]
MKITLACAAGMSTTLLCKKIQQAAEEKGYKNVTCDAFSASNLKGNAEGSAIILVGPQISYEKDRLTKEWAPIPVMVINMQDYGMINGKNVFEAAEKIMKEKKIV